MNISVKQLVLDYITTYYPISKQTAVLFFCSLSVMAVAGIIATKEILGFCCCWVIFLIISLLSLVFVRVSKTISKKYFFYATHHLFVLLMQIEVFVFCFFNLEITAGALAGVFFVTVMHCIVRGCIRCYKLNKQITINDLYYYDSVHTRQERDFKNYRTIKVHIINILLQSVFLITGVILRYHYNISWSMFLLFLSCPVQDAQYDFIPVAFYYAKLIAKQRKFTSDNL